MGIFIWNCSRAKLENIVKMFIEISEGVHN